MHNNENNHISTTVQLQKKPKKKNGDKFVTAETFSPQAGNRLPPPGAHCWPALPDEGATKEFSMQIMLQAHPQLLRLYF